MKSLGGGGPRGAAGVVAALDPPVGAALALALGKVARGPVLLGARLLVQLLFT